jgi:Transketolase, N-terminal subunit
MSDNKIMTVAELEDKCVKIRCDLLNFIYSIGMGHLGGELSMVEAAVAMYYRFLNYSVHDPKNPDRDRFILSKGHCSETLFTIFADQGAYTMEYMIEHFETLNTAKFGMHSNRKYVPQIEVSAGSLGHGLPIAVGYALGARKQRRSYRVVVMTGDGELNEGTNWEAIMAASHYGLGNLVLIVDKNSLQMTGRTDEIMNIDPLDERLAAFGWDVISIADGNDMAQVVEAFEKLPPVVISEKRRPVAVIANTVKGKCVDFMENNHKWHGGGIASEQLDQALACVISYRKEIR